MTTIISVDGVHGAVAATSNAIVPFHDAGEEVLQPGEGRPGRDAPLSTPGSPAGMLVVELSESRQIYGGIHVNVIEVVSRQQPPSSVEVPVGRDILFTAIGGDGESGQPGGDGQDGDDGTDGIEATRVSDATPGTDGGRGGDAGRGSNGANGGDGGEIHVRVRDDDTHLLLAVSWAVAGGKGGVPGRHGAPGRGGRGGRGGAGHTWNELLGYKYVCTSQCIGGGGVSNSSSNQLVRMRSQLIDRTTGLLSGIRTQAVVGGNLPEMIAQVAARYGAIMHRRIDPGACHCHGGQGNCVGCEPIPIHKHFQRAPALDGEDGQPGTPIMTSLHAGADGFAGSATIVVYNENEETQTYTSIYRLELIDFDVEDENGDGIFEPGEHLFIRRIRVRNTGGMPSPRRPISISVVPSDWFSPVEGAAGTAFLPPSIASQTSVTVEGSVKVFIRPNGDNPEPGVQFIRRERIAISAVVPWLGRPMAYFEHSRVVVLQYPCELRNPHCRVSLAQGSINKITCEVYNKGNTPIGSAARTPRKVEVDVLFPSEYGLLQSNSSEWLNKVAQEVSNVPGTKPFQVQNLLRIHDEAQRYQRVPLQLDLYIASPEQVPAEGDTDVQDNLTLVHRVMVHIQISNEYSFNQLSAYLLVTNSDTPRQRTQLIESFIRESLQMEVDTWNLGLYGGFQLPPQEGKSPPGNVLTSYHGKTIVFIGNKFKFFTGGYYSTTELCDATWLAEAISKGTNCLFLESTDPQAYEDLIKLAVFDNSSRIAQVREGLLASRTFPDVDAMITSMTEQKRFGPLGYVNYSIPVKIRWERLGKAEPQADAKKTAKKIAKKTAIYLRKNLPQQLCLVSFASSDQAAPIDQDNQSLATLNGLQADRNAMPDRASSRHHGDIMVSVGLAQHVSVVALEPASASTVSGLDVTMQRSNMAPSQATAELDRLECYMIVATLPLSRRVGLLWESSATSSDLSTPPAGTCSLFAEGANILSIIVNVNAEIDAVLNCDIWIDALLPSNPATAAPETIKDLLRIHFPALFELFYHPLATVINTHLPEQVVSILQFALGSARPQKKRHLHAVVLLSLTRRGRTYNLIKTAASALLTRKGQSRDQTASIFASTGTLHPPHDTARQIRGLVARWTHRSEHTVTKARRDARDIVGGTIYVNPEVWDQRVTLAKERTERLRACVLAHSPHTAGLVVSGSNHRPAELMGQNTWEEKARNSRSPSQRNNVGREEDV